MSIKENMLHWLDCEGECEDCGYPAAYYVLDAYGEGSHMEVCAICAPEYAAAGDTITRISKHEGF